MLLFRGSARLVGREWKSMECTWTCEDAVAMDLKSLERTWSRHCKDEFDPGVCDLESFTIHKSDVGQAPGGLSRQQSVFMTLQHAATLLLYASPVRRSWSFKFHQLGRIIHLVQMIAAWEFGRAIRALQLILPHDVATAFSWRYSLTCPLRLLCP